MDGADVCRSSSRASRRPPDIISAVAILDPRWRGRKWRHPGPGESFSTPIVVVVENGGPSASGRHLGWPHFRVPGMRSSKMAAGSGRAAIFHHHHNGVEKLSLYYFRSHLTTEVLWNLRSSGKVLVSGIVLLAVVMLPTRDPQAGKMIVVWIHPAIRCWFSNLAREWERISMHSRNGRIWGRVRGYFGGLLDSFIHVVPIHVVPLHSPNGRPFACL